MMRLLDLKKEAEEIAIDIFKQEIVNFREQLSATDRAALTRIYPYGLETDGIDLQSYYDLIDRSLKYE